MEAKPHGHPWSEDLLLSKAKLYIEKMAQIDPDNWECILWSSLALEFVLRAALAHFSPVLLARTNGSNDWRNLLFAVSMDYTSTKAKPISIQTGEVIKRLSELLTEFTKEISDFCYGRVDKRNEELHTGTMAFSDIEDKAWRPQFYRACDVLVKSIDHSLEELLPSAETQTARQMIDGLQESAKEAVKKDVAAYKVVWENKAEDERKSAQQRADGWATRDRGHRVSCPSCSTTALVLGDASGPVKRQLDGREIVAKQKMLPREFKCQACGLRISGFSKLLACNLGEVYTVTSRYSPEEHFELYTEDDIADARAEGRNEMEHEMEARFSDDFNEY